MMSTIRFLALALCMSSSLLAQSSGSKSDSDKRNSPAKSIEQIQKDYAEFLAKRQKIQDKYQENETALKKSEEELQRVGNEGVRQQLMAMQSSMQSMRINSMLSSISNSTAQTGSTNSNALAGPSLQQQQLLQNRFLQDMNTALRGQELMQLDQASRKIVQSRLALMQAGMKLQQEWSDWQKDWPKFMDRYWPVSDPERCFTQSEIDAALDALSRCDAQDYAAKITAALLMERAGQWSEADDLLDEVIKAETSLQGAALMAKSLIMTSLKKEKEAKQALQAAVKLDKANPYVRWMRARVAASQDQWAIAEPEWKFLTTRKPIEAESRRALALVHYARSQKSPGEGMKALKEANAALELETVPSWYSHYVLALALNSARKKSEAMEEIEKAIEKATDENLERCQSVRAAFEAGEYYKFDFLSGYGDRQPGGK